MSDEIGLVATQVLLTQKPTGIKGLTRVRHELLHIEVLGSLLGRGYVATPVRLFLGQSHVLVTDYFLVFIDKDVLWWQLWRIIQTSDWT